MLCICFYRRISPTLMLFCVFNHQELIPCVKINFIVEIDRIGFLQHDPRPGIGWCRIIINIWWFAGYTPSVEIVRLTPSTSPPCVWLTNTRDGLAFVFRRDGEPPSWLTRLRWKPCSIGHSVIVCDGVIISCWVWLFKPSFRRCILIRLLSESRCYLRSCVSLVIRMVTRSKEHGDLREQSERYRSFWTVDWHWIEFHAVVQPLSESGKISKISNSHPRRILLVMIFKEMDKKYRS